MNQLDDSRIESHLLESLERISYQKGVSVMALVNMAVKEFVFNMDDELVMARIPNEETVPVWIARR